MTLTEYTLPKSRLLNTQLVGDNPRHFKKRFLSEKTPSEDIWPAHQLNSLRLERYKYSLKPTLEFDIPEGATLSSFTGTFQGKSDLMPERAVKNLNIDLNYITLPDDRAICFEIKVKEFRFEISGKEIASVAALYDKEHPRSPLTDQHHFSIQTEFYDRALEIAYLITAPNKNITRYTIVDEKLSKPLPSSYWTYFGWK